MSDKILRRCRLCGDVEVTCAATVERVEPLYPNIVDSDLDVTVRVTGNCPICGVNLIDVVVGTDDDY
jgi:spore coat polysaccharide biosynthesis protein SpsF (cytidylyltransferase family)